LIYLHYLFPPPFQTASGISEALEPTSPALSSLSLSSSSRSSFFLSFPPLTLASSSVLVVVVKKVVMVVLLFSFSFSFSLSLSLAFLSSFSSSSSPSFARFFLIFDTSLFMVILPLRSSASISDDSSFRKTLISCTATSSSTLGTFLLF